MEQVVHQLEEAVLNTFEAFGTFAGCLEVPANPVPASRPKVSKWGVYYGKTYKNWMALADKAIREAQQSLSSPLLVLVVNVGEKAKTTKRKFPRGDTDNYAKGPLDVITKKKHWEDDDQIVCLCSTKRYPLKDEEPHTEVHIYTLK